MNIKELIIENSPVPGDILEIEIDDTLIEASIVDIINDDLIIHLDETALSLLISSREKLNESIGHQLKPMTQAELDLYNLEIKKLGKKIDMLNDLYVKYKNLKDMFKMSKVKERIASLTKEKSELTNTVDNRFSKVSETGAPAPHRLNPEPAYAMNEAEYQGRKVSLGKPFLTPDGPKKRSVYVKNSKGNVVKVNFGQKGVKIKKGIPARRKSFRARHNCATAKDRTTPRYWSCKFW